MTVIKISIAFFFVAMIGNNVEPEHTFLCSHSWCCNRKFASSSVLFNVIWETLAKRFLSFFPLCFSSFFSFVIFSSVSSCLRFQSYFYKKENLLSGLIFNKENITIKPEYETGKWHPWTPFLICRGCSGKDSCTRDVKAVCQPRRKVETWQASFPNIPFAVRNLGLIPVVKHFSLVYFVSLVLRFYGYDLEGASNMLTESRANATAGNMTDVTEATDSANTTVPSENDEQEEKTTTLLPDTSEDETTAADGATEANTEDNENGDVTTVAAVSRKRRGRLGRGLKSKARRDRKQSPVIKSAGQGGTKRRSRSYYVILDEDYETDFHLDSVSHAPASTVGPASTANPLSSPHPVSSAYPVSSPRPSVGKFRKSNPKDLFDNVDTDTVEHIFYLNDHDTVRVPYKIYDSVMKYAHVDTLEASILEIDLDTEYYNLIIIVPDHHDGLRDLTNKLRLHAPSTLRRIRNSMEFYWVKTVVPKFSLKGNTILTNDLQNVRLKL